MAIVSAGITPVAVQGFQYSGAVVPNTYVIATGVANQKIRLISFSLSSTAGLVTVQDSTGVIFGSVNGQGSFSSTGAFELTTAADLWVVVSQNTTIDAYFTGFIS